MPIFVVTVRPMMATSVFILNPFFGLDVLEARHDHPLQITFTIYTFSVSRFEYMVIPRQIELSLWLYQARMKYHMACSQVKTYIKMISL